MGWEAIDFFELEGTWFSEELHNVVVPLFKQGQEWLAKQEEARRDLLEKMLREAKNDEGEVQTAHAIADLEDLHNTQRGQILGTAALHYLYSTLQARLKELLRYFDKTHPPTTKGYDGKSALHRLKNEYAERVGIDFEKSPLFGGIVELALARNAGIHLGGESMKEYIENVKSPRFRKTGEFCVEPEAFMDIVNETERFYGWVVGSLVPVRKATAKPK